MSRAIDPRLVTHARATRPFLVALVALGVLSALLIITQAWLLADVISTTLAGSRTSLATPLLVLLIVVVARSALAWGREPLAARASARAKSQLRSALIEHVGALGPGRLGGARTAAIAVLATRGVDALDGYFALYLPQLCLSVIVPIAVLIAIGTQDWISALIIAATLPLIPLFMALVGASTRDRMEQQLRTLEELAGHFLDVVLGLTTLKVFGRAKAQIRAIGEVTDRYRTATMSTLRITFMSSLILELVATISVALVAVEVGLRLEGGHLDLRTALMVLVLAPEAYLPLRLLGANYHASAEGVSAAEQVFDVLAIEAPSAISGSPVPDLRLSRIVFDDLYVSYEGRGQPALDGISVTVEPGEVLAVTGPSGAGKSTLLGVLLGFVERQRGAVRVGDADLTELDPDAWRAEIAWVPQRPYLFGGSIAENIALGRADATRDEIQTAASAAGLDRVIEAKPAGLETVLAEHGAGLSVGERQRVAVARAFLRDSPLLLLDEPTANLDGETEDEVVSALRRLVQGRTVILVAHRPALLGLADRVLELGEVRVPA